MQTTLDWAIPQHSHKASVYIKFQLFIMLFEIFKRSIIKSLRNAALYSLLTILVLVRPGSTTIQ